MDNYVNSLYNGLEIIWVQLSQRHYLPVSDQYLPDEEHADLFLI